MSSAPPHRGALLGLVVGILLTTVPAALWLAGAGAPGTAAPTAAPAPTTAPAVVPAGAVPTPPAPAGTAVAPTAPVRIRLAGVEVDAPVVPVGVDERGEMAVPEDVRTVGWYRFGPGPGATAGSSVLAGHVDDQIQGRGAFFRLAELAVDDPVQVQLADGTELGYRVAEVVRVNKAELPVDRLFARDGRPRLTLITCGGEFDRAARRFQDNVVVVAEPA